MTRTRLVVPILFLVAAAASAQPCTTLTAPGFARIDGIRGEATDLCHKDEVQLFAPAMPRGSTVTLVKAIDAASPALVLACATGKHISQVKITTFNPSNMNAIVIHQLHDVLVNSVDIRAGNVMREEITLGFAKIETQQAPGTIAATMGGGGPLPAQMAVYQGGASSNGSLPCSPQVACVSLSAFRFMIQNRGGKADVSAAVNSAPGVFPDNATVGVKAGRFTWYLMGAKPAGTAARSLAGAAPTRIANPRGETALQFSTFRIYGGATGTAPPVQYDLSAQQKQ